MQYNKKEYRGIGYTFSLLVAQGSIVSHAIVTSFPQTHRLNRLAFRASPAVGSNENFINFKSEFENWCCQDLPSSENPLKVFNYHPEAQKLNKQLVGVPEKLSRLFLTLTDVKSLKVTRKKPGLNRLELIVSILFFHELNNQVYDLAIKAFEYRFPATNAIKYAKIYLTAVQALTQALQEELANIELEEATV